MVVLPDSRRKYDDTALAAASWAQHRWRRTPLIKTCEKAGIELTLFHGRGGFWPWRRQPTRRCFRNRRSSKGGLRVTGWWLIFIRFKCMARRSHRQQPVALHQRNSEANLLPPPEPKDSWRHIMDELSVISCETYRATCAKIKTCTVLRPRRNKSWANCRSAHVRRNVVQLAVASNRCARFRDSPDAKPPDAASPAGRGYRAAKVVEDGKQSELEAMCRDWPFFHASWDAGNGYF